MAIEILKPESLPVKVNVNGTEWIIIYNDVTKKLERFIASNYEITSNKAVDFSVINDVKYPTTKAVNDQKGVANGLATLDGSGKLTPAQIPDIAITKVVVATETTITAFAANSANYTFEQGDVILITNTGVVKHYLFKGGTKTVVTEYSEISASQVTIAQVIGLQAALDLKAAIVDVYTKVQADLKYLLNTTDTLTGNLTVTGVGTFADIISKWKGNEPINFVKTNGINEAYVSVPVTSNTDLNAINNTPGVFFAENYSTENRPVAQAGAILQLADATGNDVKTQFYNNSSGSDIFTRIIWGSAAGGAKPWRRLFHDGNSNLPTVDWETKNLKLSGNLQRTSHSSGHLEGSYNNVGSNTTKTNPIYTMGSSYNPSDTALNDMYGIGYSKNDAPFLNATLLGAAPSAGWGQYIASDGGARIFLNATDGNGFFKGDLYANKATFRGIVTSNQTIAQIDDGSVKTLTPKEWVLAKITENLLGYKFYAAELTQTGTSAPVATIMRNTLGFVPTWVYLTVAEYTTTNAAFIDGKTAVIIQGNGENIFYSKSGTTIKILSGSNGKLNKTYVEIKVYD